MASKVVSTKLSIEEHGKFLEICRIQNCTPSTLIKNLILNLITNLEKTENLSHQKQFEKTTSINQKEQHSFVLQNQSRLPQFSIDETTVNELLKKIENDQVSIDDLNQLYLKLGEKFEKTGLSKNEEHLYRKTHQKLKERLQYKPIVKNLQQTKPQPEEKKTDEKNMNVEERFQYF